MCLTIFLDRYWLFYSPPLVKLSESGFRGVTPQTAFRGPGVLFRVIVTRRARPPQAGAWWSLHGVAARDQTHTG